jgi:hypothetical protein
MRYPAIVVPFLNVQGMAIYPFILLKKATYKKDEVIMRHETIHLKQQQEMLVLPFYIAYLINYLFNLAKYRNHDQAYRNIIFEREAYACEGDAKYLINRPLWAFLRR